jgi:excisionase family DNA binding protein
MRTHSDRGVAPGALGGSVTWLTVGQAAKHLGVAERTLRRWATDGRIPAYSTPGGHRRFRVADVEAFLDDARVGVGESPRKSHVLLIDDDERRRASVAYALESEGCEVLEAAHARDAFEAVDAAAPDLILMNVAVDGIDGIELLCKLRDAHGLEAVSVVMFTGRGRTAGRDTGRARVAPPRPGPLVDAARRVLAAAPAPAARRSHPQAG